MNTLYLLKKKNTNHDITPVNIFTGVYNDSTIYGVTPSTNSCFDFDYYGTSIVVALNRTYVSTSFDYCSLFINNQFYVKIDFNGGVEQTITLPVGFKNIKIKTSYTFGINDVVTSACYIQSVVVNSTYSIKSENKSSGKLIFIGDSITSGNNTSNVNVTSYSGKFSMARPTSIIGYGRCKVFDLASTQDRINIVRSQITQHLSEVIGVKNLVIQVSTNDAGIDQRPVEQLIAWYESLVTNLITDNPDLNITCIGPFSRSPSIYEDLCVQYRLAIEEMCTRLGLNYVNGPSIVPYNTTNYSGDGLHLLDDGNLLVYNYLNALLY